MGMNIIEYRKGHQSYEPLSETIRYITIRFHNSDCLAKANRIEHRRISIIEKK